MEIWFVKKVDLEFIFCFWLVGNWELLKMWIICVFLLNCVDCLCCDVVMLYC